MGFEACKLSILARCSSCARPCTSSSVTSGGSMVIHWTSTIKNQRLSATATTYRPSIKAKMAANTSALTSVISFQ